MKPIKSLIWMSKRGSGNKKGMGDGGHNMPLPPFLPHIVWKKQIHPSGGGGRAGCPHKDFTDAQIHTPASHAVICNVCFLVSVIMSFVALSSTFGVNLFC